MQFDSIFVSVIIPVYNGEQFVKAAVENIQQQNYQSLEIIIVDDGSTDNTAKIATNFGSNVRYIYQSNSGPAAARNRGLEVAIGEVIAFLDVDDLWSYDKLKLQLATLTANPSVDIVLGKIQCLKLEENTVDKPEFVEFEAPFVSFIFGSAIFRKSVFKKVGHLNDTMRFSEDVDWFMRARECGAVIVVLEQVTLFYRRHQQNMTLQKQECNRNFVAALKQSLDRRRQQNGSVASLPNLFYINSSTG